MFGDILQGKDIQQAIADRYDLKFVSKDTLFKNRQRIDVFDRNFSGIEALGSLDPDVLKVIQALRNGESLEDVLSKAYVFQIDQHNDSDSYSVQ